MFALLVHPPTALGLFVTEPRCYCVRRTIPPAASFFTAVVVAIVVITAVPFAVRLARTEASRVVVALRGIIAHAFTVTTFSAGPTVAAVSAFARVVVAI